MEINDGKLKHPKNVDPPKIVIMQRPLTKNKQRKSKVLANKQHAVKISTTPSPHSRHESPESKFCASCVAIEKFIAAHKYATTLDRGYALQNWYHFYK